MYHHYVWFHTHIEKKKLHHQSVFRVFVVQMSAKKVDLCISLRWWVKNIHIEMIIMAAEMRIARSLISNFFFWIVKCSTIASPLLKMPDNNQCSLLPFLNKIKGTCQSWYSHHKRHFVKLAHYMKLVQTNLVRAPNSM